MSRSRTRAQAARRRTSRPGRRRSAPKRESSASAARTRPASWRPASSPGTAPRSWGRARAGGRRRLVRRCGRPHDGLRSRLGARAPARRARRLLVCLRRAASLRLLAAARADRRGGDPRGRAGPRATAPASRSTSRPGRSSTTRSASGSAASHPTSCSPTSPRATRWARSPRPGSSSAAPQGIVVDGRAFPAVARHGRRRDRRRRRARGRIPRRRARARSCRGGPVLCKARFDARSRPGARMRRRT